MIYNSLKNKLAVPQKVHTFTDKKCLSINTNPTILLLYSSKSLKIDLVHYINILKCNTYNGRLLNNGACGL